MQQSELRRLAQHGVEMQFIASAFQRCGRQWWRLDVVIGSDTQDQRLRVVDAHDRDRRWRQLNAMVHFLRKICGGMYQLEIPLETATAATTSNEDKDEATEHGP